MAAYLGCCVKGRFLERDSCRVCQFAANFFILVMTANGINYEPRTSKGQGRKRYCPAVTERTRMCSSKKQ
jgi:hypothetical protein